LRGRSEHYPRAAKLILMMVTAASDAAAAWTAMQAARQLLEA
jgi:hypothetical protein